MNASAPIRCHRRLSAGAALIGASVLAALAGCASGAAPAHQPSAPGALPSGPRSASSLAPLSPPAAVDAAYRSAVETRVARALHLTPEQVRADLRGSSGPGLENVAKPRGVAEDQLARIILAGLGSAASSASRSGRWTAGQARAEKMYWASRSSADLIAGVGSWFVNG